MYSNVTTSTRINILQCTYVHLRLFDSKLHSPLRVSSIRIYILIDGFVDPKCNRPDINSNQLHINTEETITGGTFQLLVLYLNTQNEDIEMIITNNILKNKIENHNNISNIKENIKLKSDNLPCVQLTNVLCAFKLHVPGTYFVNITLLLLKYYGPNVGYCKYGGLSVYDYVHTDKKRSIAFV